MLTNSFAKLSGVSDASEPEADIHVRFSPTLFPCLSECPVSPDSYLRYTSVLWTRLDITSLTTPLVLTNTYLTSL